MLFDMWLFMYKCTPPNILRLDLSLSPRLSGSQPKNHTN